MKFVFVIVTSLVFVAVPARAQQGGLPALQGQVKILQQQVSDLQNQVTNLSAALPVDDGTAAALVGTWTGSANDLEFSSAATQFFFRIFNIDMPFFIVPQASSPLNVPFAPAPIGVNPDIWLGRGSVSSPNSITLTITRQGMNLSGSVDNSEEQQSGPVTVSGIVLGNNFFLLRVLMPASGSCAPTGRVVLQGVGSLNAVTNPPTVRRMTVTGSGIQGDCSHSFFRVALTKN